MACSSLACWRMGFDARLKRNFPLVLIPLIMLVAYLQAAGLGQLVAANLGNVALPASPVVIEQAQKVADASERATDGSAILARNAFDSITGPLTGKRDETTAPEPARENNGDPYADPACDSAKVLLITTADDPSWSFAAISTGNEKSALRRIGDEVAGHTVYAMVWDRVWMMKSGSRCQIPLHQAVASTSTSPKAIESTAKPARPGAGLPPDIAEKIRRNSDTQFDVDRSLIATVMERQAEFFKSVRIVPSRDAEGTSLKLSGIKPGSLLGSLGLVNGDKLMTINKFEMGDMTTALQALPRLQTADKLDVKVIRGGKPVSIEINVR
jgi:general secretion pathway protein C